MDFGSRLKKHRLLMKIRQKELANELNISTSSIGMYERNERQPSFEILERMSIFFGVSIDYLLTGKEFFQNEKVVCIKTDDLTDENLKKLKEYIEFLKWKQ